MSASNVVISGVGQSDIGRYIPRSGLALTIEAIFDALDNAGLEASEIDGVATYPGARPDMLGFGPVSCESVIDALRLNVDWYSGGIEGAAQFGAIVNAYAAIKAGLANHVICFRTVKEGTAVVQGRKNPPIETAVRRRASGDFQWLMPYKAMSAANWLSLYANKHFHRYGTTREQMGQISINARKNAALNPKAIYRDPISLDDYLQARMISTPFGLLDCDAPTDGSTVIILSNKNMLGSSVKAPVYIESVGSAIHSRPSWDQADAPFMAAFDAAKMMWSRSDFSPSDVDVAELYDGFSFLAMTWLEAAGFCGVGESGTFIGDGKRIALDGELPLNTHGGQIAAGRTHGFGFIHEAVTQLRGEAGVRQVQRPLSTAMVAAGGGPIAGCLLLAT